ncbi:MAG: polyol transport system permease protein [Thermomicrobiales bacterium]|jgi:sorbitol/mannitol transport system permease protein|nr:polyol transport system permease protein [Thermomicrobiales bacterium]
MIRQATGRSSGFRKEQAPIYWTITAWAVGLIVFFPVLYIVLTGLKSEATAITLPPKLIFRPTLEQYREISSRGFFPFFRNSIIASLVSTLIVLILAVPAAYALALRPMKRWRDVLFFFISTKFMPPAGVIIPLYIIYKDIRIGGFHMLNSIPGLIVVYVAMNLPIAIWMLRSFFEEVPQGILDAARVDGAGIGREILQILLPMVGPGIAATAFLSIIFAWNEFFFAVNLVATEKAATVPLFMQKFITSEGLFWAKLSAASTMAFAPVVVLGWISQRQLVRGLSMGAVK